MDIHGTHAAVVVVAPDAVQKIAACEDASSVGDQVFEEFVFFEGEFDNDALYPDFVSRQVDDQVFDLEDVFIVRLVASI